MCGSCQMSISVIIYGPKILWVGVISIVVSGYRRLSQLDSKNDRKNINYADKE